MQWSKTARMGCNSVGREAALTKVHWPAAESPLAKLAEVHFLAERHCARRQSCTHPAASLSNLVKPHVSIVPIAWESLLDRHLPHGKPPRQRG